MGTQFSRTQIAEGIYLSLIQNDKFTSNRITVNLISPLSQKTASAYSCLPLLLRRGYRECPDFSQFNRLLNSLYGAEIDYNTAALGDNQVISLSIKSISDRFTINGEEVSFEAAKILCSMILDPVIEDGTFKQSDFETEKQFLIDSIKAELNDKGALALLRCRQTMCKGEPYAISCHGTLETAEKLSCREVFDAYNNLLKTAHIEIMFTGSGNCDVVKDIMTTAFTSSIERGEVYKINSEIKKRSMPVKRVTERYNIVQSKLCMGFSTLTPIGDKDGYAMSLFNAIFGATPFSKLFVNVREKLSLCYYCSASFDGVKGVIFVNSGVEEKNCQKAQDEILNQLSLVQNGEISAEEFENTKKLLCNVLTATEDSVGKLEKFFFSRIITGRMLTPQEEFEIISSLTIDDVVAAANKVQLDTVYFMAPKEDEE